MTHTEGTDIWQQTTQFYNECKSTDPSLRLNFVSIRKVHLTHTHRDGTDIWPQTAQFYNECKSTNPRLLFEHSFCP